MRWRTGRRSENIEDRRGSGGFPGGGVGRTAVGGGIGTVVLVLAALYFGMDPTVFLGTGGMEPAPVSTGMPGQAHSPALNSGAEDELKGFVSVVLADTEDTWNELFRQLDGRYSEPTLVIYSGMTRSACGLGQAAMGPFYCPEDQKLYVDLSFYDELRSRYGAPGDFAQAYVIAHEVGHHVQNLLGISDQVQAAQQRVGKAAANELSVRLELQADCFAGVWANRADRSRDILEAGDAEEALRAAAAIGDDRLQRQAQGYVVPDSFTHGSSEQRARWFRLGLEHGDLNVCDTFGTERL
jgi:predicted metalloprotease